jgi:mRNA interferase MazF
MALPNAGDIIWVDLDDARGSEQSGRRPALVLSPLTYHEASPRTIVCPITRRVRGWPTEVVLPDGLMTAGVVLCDQIRTIDRGQRPLFFAETAPASLMVEVRRRIASLLGIEMIANPSPP